MPDEKSLAEQVEEILAAREAKAKAEQEEAKDPNKRAEKMIRQIVREENGNILSDIKKALGIDEEGERREEPPSIMEFLRGGKREAS